MYALVELLWLYRLKMDIFCSKTGSKVAIKQMKNIFDEPTDAKRAYREIHILRYLSDTMISLSSSILSVGCR
jgi:hypothetical protein